MANFKKVRPNEEIRLKKWGPGRISQLKIMVSNLEQAANRSLASQVAQSPKRRFSEFVPIIPIQDITGQVEFREIRMEFEPPKGLRNLLFYEYQISRTLNFAAFDTFLSPDPSYVFSNLEDNTRFYVRARVVTTDGLVGPYSDAVTAVTPAAKAQGSLDTTESQTTLSSSTFSTIFTKTVTTLGGKVYYSLQYNTQPETSTIGQFKYSTAEFRWLEDGVMQGQFFLVTNYSYGGEPGTLSIFDGDIATSANPLTATTEFVTRKRGTFVQKFHSITSGDHTITLEGRIVNYHTLPNEFQFNAGAAVVDFAGDTTISLKNFTFFEVFTQA